MTDAEYLLWLKSPSSIRCVLVHANVLSGDIETTRYLSNYNYVTGAADTPANTAYLAVLSGGVTVTEKLSIDGSASLSFGDIEINNTGSLDSWVNDIWTNRSISVYVGDPRWARNLFRLVFTGTLAGVGSRARNTLNLALRDKLQRLNTPVTETKLGGATDNKDVLVPLCFGECHNVTPLLINPATLQYQVHAGAIESIIEVRDNGVPISFTANLTIGTFTLNAQPAGTVTCSVQGDKLSGVYVTTVCSIVKRIVTGYGQAATRFTTGDLDASNLAAFETANPQPVGLYLPDRTNVLEACAQLAASLGAQLVMSRVGLLRLLKIELPVTGTPTVVTAAEMEERSLNIADKPTIMAAIKLGYCKNWTVQSNLQTGITEAQKNLMALEWLSVTTVNTTVINYYKLTSEPAQADTLLITNVASNTTASTEASRRLALWGMQRTVYGYSGTPALLLEALGGYQTIFNSRFGLENSVSGQIVGLTQDWLKGRVQLEVLV
jgi:hypothetical protein